MSENKIKVPIKEASEKVEKQIKKGIGLVEEGSKIFKKSMGRIRRLDDNFENKYEMWLNITVEVLDEVFVSTKYSYDFKEKTSSQVEYVNSDWKPDIKYWVTKELIPKIDYLTVLKENISEFEFISEKPNITKTEGINLNIQNAGKILEKLIELIKDPSIIDGYESNDVLISWASKVAPLLQYNPQYQSKFISYQEIAIVSHLKVQTRQAVQLMKSQVNMAIEELKLMSELKKTDSQVPEKFFPKGFYYDATKSLGEIIKSAKSKIFLIDNYIDESILDFFTLKQSNVELLILTQDLKDAMKHYAKQFSLQYGKLEIRISKDYHDRFLIIDETTFYHFGASLKDLGNKAFMFSKIEEEKNKATLLEKWQTDWMSSNAVI
jgi:hypothetical protein